MNFFVRHFLRHWFLYSLIFLIPAGMWLGQSSELRQQVETHFDSSWIVFVVLFFMTATLELDSLLHTATRPWGVMWAVMVNSVLIPLLCWGCVLLFPVPHYSAGLLLMGTVPSTLASAAVWTRRAGGNDALPLIVTLITNGSCFLVIPFWLSLSLGTLAPIDVPQLMLRLLLIALLPMMLGQFVRLSPWVRRAADRHRQILGTLAQIGILIIVATSSVRTGPMVNLFSTDGSWGHLLLIFVQCLSIHILGLWAGWAGMRSLLKGSREDAIGTMFAGGQKTLAIAIDLATSPVLLTSGMSPLAILPPLIFHAAQLILDSWLIEKVQIVPERNQSVAEA